jgi:uncharacterized protein
MNGVAEELTGWTFSEVEQNTTAEAVVVSSESCNGDAFSYAMQIFDSWKIGKAENDNGLLILYCKQENKIWVTTGYGLEGILPDAKLGRMLDDYYVPQRDSGNVTSGIIAFSEQAASVIQENAVEVRAGKAGSNSGLWAIFAVIVVFFIIFVIFYKISRARKEKEMKKELRVSASVIVSDANSFKRTMLQLALTVIGVVFFMRYSYTLDVMLIFFLFILWLFSGVIAGFIFPPKCSKCRNRLKFWKNDSGSAYYKCSNGHVLKKQGRGARFIPVPIGGGGGHGGFGGGGFGGGGSGGGGAGR